MKQHEPLLINFMGEACSQPSNEPSLPAAVEQTTPQERNEAFQTTTGVTGKIKRKRDKKMQGKKQISSSVAVAVPVSSQDVDQISTNVV